MANYLKTSNKVNINQRQPLLDEDVKIKSSGNGDAFKQSDEDVENEVHSATAKNAAGTDPLASGPPFPPESESFDEHTLDGLDISDTDSDDSEDMDKDPKTWEDIYDFFKKYDVDLNELCVSFTYAPSRKCFEVSTGNVFYLKSIIERVLRTGEVKEEGHTEESKPCIADLMDFLEHKIQSKKPLTPNIEFHGGPFLPDIVAFAESYASQIQVLMLCYNCEDVGTDTLVSVSPTEYIKFLQYFTSARSFELGFPNQWTDVPERIPDTDLLELDTIQLNLPNLKSISLSSKMKVAKVAEAVFAKVLTGAENLETIENAFPTILEVIHRLGKNNLIKQLDVSPKDDERHSHYRANYHAFSETEPKLTKLNIGFDALRLLKKENEKALNNMLNSSKDCLEELWIYPLARLQNLQLPILSAVKKLHICMLPTDNDRDFQYALRQRDFHYGYEAFHLVSLSVREWKDSDHGIFPKHLDASIAFPNLQSVTLDLVTNATHFSRLYFPTRPCIPSVKKLHVSDCCTNTWLKKLHLIFPNVTNLVMGFNAADVETGRDMWQLWQGLESLYFQFVVWDNVTYPTLDTIFTGIPEKTCAKLRRDKVSHAGKTRGAEKLRKKSSICLLKDLKLLKMRLMNRQKVEETTCCAHELLASAKSQCEFLLISPVSLLYAFECMPDLKVVVEYDKECSDGLSHDLNSLWPHVTFEEVD